MRSRTLYEYPPRQKRVASREVLICLLVVACIAIGARLDYLMQRDCAGNSDCLHAVMR